MICQKCSEELPDDNVFCEACGERLAPIPATPVPTAIPGLCLCGAPDSDLDTDGFCLSCGRRCRAAAEDHIEIELSPDFAAVSDKGKQHSRNEDRVQLQIGADRQVIVICDGVSNSNNSDAAAAAATQTAAKLLAAGGTFPDAIKEAAKEVKALALSQMEVCPSTTIVAAVIHQTQIQLAWLGDSRAYWVPASGEAQPLTRDHSWMNDVVAAGQMTIQEAEQAPLAHGITRWLGADSQDTEPETTVFNIPGPGWLLLCTDGLWNYAPEADTLAKLVTSYAAAEPNMLGVARRLVDFANARGGRDNITAALLAQRKDG